LHTEPAPAPEGNVADQAIYLLDVDGNVARWNDDAGRLDGYTLREVVGTPFRQFFSAEDREQGTSDRALDAAVREGHASVEAWRVRKDGRPIALGYSSARCARPTTGSRDSPSSCAT
jgi:PAS domain S-box-containing protein